MKNISLNKSLYLTGDELISKLDEKIESRGNILRNELKEDRKSLNTKKGNLVYA